MNAVLVQEVPGRFSKLGPENDDVTSSAMRLVAVRGAIGDWAAYFGHPDASIQEVRRYGHKLSEKAARELFPSVGGAYRD